MLGKADSLPQTTERNLLSKLGCVLHLPYGNLPEFACLEIQRSSVYTQRKLVGLEMFPQFVFLAHFTNMDYGRWIAMACTDGLLSS